MRRLSIVIALGLVACVVACGDEPPPERRTTYGGDRPARLYAPRTLTAGKAYPLVVVLHGYGANGLLQRAYFGVQTLVDTDQALVVAPDGNVDRTGKQFWNADPACCDLEGAAPDDVGYLAQLIDDITAEWPVDRVFLLGHSNGGFMAYRLACTHADKLDAIVPLAAHASQLPCTPARPVDVLHIHGTADDVVPYAGAEPSVQQWAMHNACTGARTASAAIDYDGAVDGAETTPSAYAGCPADGAVELWTMTGSTHVPAITPAFTPAVFAWMLDHAPR